MSRVARKPIAIPKNVEVVISDNRIQVKGKQGQLEINCHETVAVERNENIIQVAAKQENKEAKALAGTMRSLIQNMITGVSEGFTKKLILVGVGYRAQVQGKTLNLTLGLSHPAHYPIPEGITIDTPSQTEIVIKGRDKQQVGQVAAEIRDYRRPEPYKGKGIRYADETIILKETKKK